MGALSDDLRWRGLVQQVSAEELLGLLDTERLSAYVGFDPTADSLHVGNLLMICTLRRLQLAGHRPIALAGGGTGLVGDPGGRAEERPLLDPEEHRANLEGIRAQLERFLETGGRGGALLLDNAEWLCRYPLTDFLRDVGKHFTVNQMIAKESVRSRLERPDRGISFTEFSYMLLQAYDFLHLYDRHGCRLQLGGSDQWGNITMGIELVRKARGATVYGLTSPLVLRPDGTKFGKTAEGAVWLDRRRTSPFALYQFFVRVEDVEVGRYLRLFTFLEREEILALEDEASARPERREAQRRLAWEVCALVHGREEADRAARASRALYGGGDMAELDEQLLLEAFEEAPSSVLPFSALDEGLELVDALVRTGLSPSRRAARTAIVQGGAYVNNRRRLDPAERLTREDLVAGRYVVLRRGRREHHLLRFA